MHEPEALSIPGGPRPSTQDCEGWATFWAGQGQPWRTEPEIDAGRQAELTALRNITPDVHEGIYPFKNIKLGRADIEWLLATHENGCGPVDYYDESQRDRVGLDLRGADLRHAQLQNLPLARTLADVSWRTWTDLTEGQHRMAAVLLEGADLKGAHLEGASLEYAHMDEADLRHTHLQDANLGTTSLQFAYLEEAHLEGANLMFANLQNAFLWGTYLGGANLKEAHLDGAHLNRLVFCNEQGVGPYVADTLWGSANLAVVYWSRVKMLGDEYEARQQMRTGQALALVELGFSTSYIEAQRRIQASKVKDRETRLIEFKLAVRANRQLALALQAQGLNEEAARFSYRAQILRRKLLWQRGPSQFVPYLSSLFLAVLTGYGYRMGRIIVAYALVNILFASLYYLFGRFLPTTQHLDWVQALIMSITAFHGRVFSNTFTLGSPQSIVTACEAVTGLIFEGIFIAMLTQKFFGR